MKKSFKLFAYILSKFGTIFFGISNKIYSIIKTNEEKRYIQTLNKYKIDQADKTLRLHYPLNENSVIFDLGGYEGQWASDIFSKYLSFVYIFEPHPDFVQKIKNRFEKNVKIKVFEFGLASETKTEYLTSSLDGSSIFTDGKEKLAIKLIKASDFLKENQMLKIDLMKINIEGAEYDLLIHLIKEDLIKYINNLQIQFHYFVPNASRMMKEIHDELVKTHHLTWQYEFIWENWKRND